MTKIIQPRTSARLISSVEENRETDSVLPPEQEETLFVIFGHNNPPFITPYSLPSFVKVEFPREPPTSNVLALDVTTRNLTLATVGLQPDIINTYEFLSRRKDNDLFPQLNALTQPNTVRFNRNGLYMGIGDTVGTRLVIYETVNYTQLADPTEQVNADTLDLAWSNSILATGVDRGSSPVRTYNTDTIPFQKQPNLPQNQPNRKATGVDIDILQQFLVGVSNSQNRLFIWDLFQPAPYPRLPDAIGGNPGDNPTACRFNADGTLLAVSSEELPKLSIYDTTVIPFQRIADPDIIPNAIINSVAWSNDGNFLACATDTSPFVLLYDTSVIPFQKLPDPAVFPIANANGVIFSP